MTPALLDFETSLRQSPRTNYKRGIPVSRFLCACCLALLPLSSFAATPEETLMSDEALRIAVVEVMQMQADELMLFSSYLATCTAASSFDAEMAHFQCLRERNLFASRFSRGRSLDRMISALGIANKLIRLEGRANTSANAKIGGIIERVVFVEGMLEEASASRSVKLMGSL